MDFKNLILRSLIQFLHTLACTSGHIFLCFTNAICRLTYGVKLCILKRLQCTIHVQRS